MATANTLNQALVVAGNIPLPQGVFGGQKKLIQDSYTVGAGTVALGSVISGLSLPHGAIIVGIKLVWTAFGTGVTLDVGDGDDPDRYYDGLDVASAGEDDSILQASIGYKVGTADDDELFKITTGVATADTGAKVTILITYV